MSPINTERFGSHRGPQSTALDAFRSRGSHNPDGFSSRRPVSATIADSVEAPLHAGFSSESPQQPPSSTAYGGGLAISENDWKLDSAEDPVEEDSDPNPYRRVYKPRPSPARPLVQNPKPTIQPPAQPQVHKGPPAAPTDQRENNPYHRVYVTPQHNQEGAKQAEVPSTQPEYNPNRRVYSSSPALHPASSQHPGYNPYHRVYGSPQPHYQQLHKRSEIKQGSAALTILTLVVLACALSGLFFAGKAVYRCVQRRREGQWAWRCTGRWSRVEEEEWVNGEQTQGKTQFGAV